MNSDRKGKGNTLKIIELGLESKVFDAMKKPGFSVERLTRELTADGVKITAQSIRKFIKKSKKAQQELIASDLQVAEQFKNTIIDYGKALKSILHEVTEIKNEAKNAKDLATVNQMIGRLFQGIELIAKLTGDIKPKGSIDINIIYNEIDSDVEKKMKVIKSELQKEAIDIDAEIIEEDKKSEEAIRKNASI